MKPKILIVTGAYLPGVKAGGPIQSIKNIIDTFHDSFDFYVVTSDRDLGDFVPYNNVALHMWTRQGFANVYYVNGNAVTFSHIHAFLEEQKYQAVYINSFFSWEYSIKWIVSIKIWGYGGRVVLAPRGEFSVGAYRQKYLKKRLFTVLAKASGLYERVIWQATSQNEIEDIQRVWNKSANILEAANIVGQLKPFQRYEVKNAGELKAVFISRIHPKKNLLYALEVLRYIHGKVFFSIYGPIEDEDYWEICKKEISVLPSNIQIEYKGVLKHESVPDVLSHTHLFVLPTLGENFGHSIREALQVGTPVLISTQTPWRSLREKQAGADVDLADKEEFIRCLQAFVDMSAEAYEQFEHGAYQYSASLQDLPAHRECYRVLFQENY